MLDFWNYFQKIILEGNPPWNNFIKVGGMLILFCCYLPNLSQKIYPTGILVGFHDQPMPLSRKGPKGLHARDLQLQHTWEGGDFSWNMAIFLVT